MKIGTYVDPADIDFASMDSFELDRLDSLVQAERLRRAPPTITLTEPEKCLIAGGHNIAAIRMIRERLDPKPSLRAAKDAIDAYRATLPGVVVEGGAQG